MKFELRNGEEWAIVATGQDSPVRMDGSRGCEIVGQCGQKFYVFEQGGKIQLEMTPAFEPCPPKKR